MRASSALMGLTAPNRFEEDATNTMADEVLAGLKAQQKRIPSKYFYDARGSKLFELICNLPEYYPTRIELTVALRSRKGNRTRDRARRSRRIGIRSKLENPDIARCPGSPAQNQCPIYAGGYVRFSFDESHCRADNRLS